MEQWLKIGASQVEELLKKDSEFQELLTELKEAEKRYTMVRAKLSPSDREIVEDYISLCEDVEYWKTHTAYKVGRMFR